MRLLGKATEIFFRLILPIGGGVFGLVLFVYYVGSNKLTESILSGIWVVLSILVLWLANRKKARRQWQEAYGVMPDESDQRDDD